MKIKVLYAEDEEAMAEIITDSFKSSGYEVIRVPNGQAALKAFRLQKPDICILDIMMPFKDGYTLAEDIRKIDNRVPIIFLSARSLTDDVVRGFKSGGNDYLKKPFNIDELLIRMESLLTRFGGKIIENELVTEYRFGNCILDVVTHKLTTSAGRFNLSHKEFTLLELLINHKNGILERQNILMKIWGDDSFYNSNSLNVFITHLRRMLKEEDMAEIKGIRNIGYQLIC